MAWIFTLFISTGAFAAKHETLWIKVEESKKEAVKTTDPEHHFDSLEADSKAKAHKSLMYWQRSPLIGAGLAFIFDKPYQKSQHEQPYALTLHGSFSNKGWRRWDVKAMIDGRSELTVMAMHQWTPSQKSIRYFYGLGAALHMQSELQLKNIISPNNYWLAAGAGVEVLVLENSGLRLECDGFLGLINSGLIFNLSYVWQL